MINFSLFIIKYEMESLAMSQQNLWKLIFASWLVRQSGDWSELTSQCIGGYSARKFFRF